MWKINIYLKYSNIFSIVYMQFPLVVSNSFQLKIILFSKQQTSKNNNFKLKCNCISSCVTSAVSLSIWDTLCVFLIRQQIQFIIGLCNKNTTFALKLCIHVYLSQFSDSLLLFLNRHLFSIWRTDWIGYLFWGICSSSFVYKIL